MVECFPTEILQQFPSLLCRLYLDIVVEENHTVANKIETLCVPTTVQLLGLPSETSVPSASPRCADADVRMRLELRDREH
jgi:hypothetical protein